MWSSRASELQAATTANQLLVHANRWFLTCKHKEKRDRRDRSQLSAQQKSRENHNSDSGPNKSLQMLQAKSFCFLSPFCTSCVPMDHWLHSREMPPGDMYV